MIVLSAVEVVYSPPDRANQWKTLRPSGSPDLGLWELPSDILADIEWLCGRAVSDCRNKKNANSVDKFRITQEQIKSILWERKHPGGLIRRTDFVPLWTFNNESGLISEDRMYQAVFGSDEISWLTISVDLPPVQPWPRVPPPGFDLKSLICLFARLMKDECFASIQLGPIVTIHEARLNEQGLLRIMDPDFASRASVYKGRLVWVAENDKLVRELCAAWDDDAWDWMAPFGLESFCSNFMHGSLHVVEAMDVTNSKMQLRPPVRPEGAEFSLGAPGEPADAPMDLPGASHDATHIETRLEHAPVVCSLTNYCLTMVPPKIQAPCHAMMIYSE